MKARRSDHVYAAGSASTATEKEEDENAKRTVRNNTNICQAEKQKMPAMRVCDGIPLAAGSALGVWLMQFY
jgi:hypothetical protein